MWEYEKKVPVIADTHAGIAGFAREAYKQIQERSKGTIEWADEKATDTRKKVEELVKEGR